MRNLVRSERFSADLTLYRGERLEVLPHLLQRGLEPQKRWEAAGMPHMSWVGLCATPADLLGFSDLDVIVRHVKGERSPFLSVSRNEGVAAVFAFGKEMRTHGLILVMNFRLVM